MDIVYFNSTGNRQIFLQLNGRITTYKLHDQRMGVTSESLTDNAQFVE